jgi:hypothetical protein
MHVADPLAEVLERLDLGEIIACRGEDRRILPDGADDARTGITTGCCLLQGRRVPGKVDVVLGGSLAWVIRPDAGVGGAAEITSGGDQRLDPVTGGGLGLAEGDLADDLCPVSRQPSA